MVVHSSLTGAHLHDPKAHTHTESEITDLDKYTQAQIDAMLAAIVVGEVSYLTLADTPSSFSGEGLKYARVNAGETAIEFATLNLSAYLPLSGGDLSGDLRFSDDGEGIKFATEASTFFSGMKVDRAGNQLVIGGDTSVDWGGYAKVNIETFELDIGSSNAAFTGLYGYDATVADFVGLIRVEGPDATDLSFAHGDAGISLAGKNVQIGAAGEWAADAEGALQISNGTAPSASITDGVVLYAEDVAASSELKVRDEAGNVTTLSPHNFTGTEPSEKMAWAFHSEKDGEYITVDMMQVVRLVEKMAGQKLVHTGEVDVRGT